MRKFVFYRKKPEKKQKSHKKKFKTKILKMSSCWMRVRIK